LNSDATEIDVLLICALKDEYDQVLSVTEGLVGDGWQEFVTAGGWTVSDASFSSITNKPIHIRTTWASYMGRETTQAITSKLIHEQPARCIAMSGICAGRRGKVSLGDVIFAERMWSYDAGKLTVEDGKQHFQCDEIQYRPSHTWVQRMQQINAKDASWISSRPRLPLEYQEEWVLRRMHDGEDPVNHPDFGVECPNWNDVLTRLWKRGWVDDNSTTLTESGAEVARKSILLHPQKIPAPLEFQIHVAPLATGAQVTEDDGIFPRLAESMRKVLGVEMEASGIAAFGEVNEIPVVVAKGVSDFGDALKDDQYRNFAAKAAAECLIQFLRNASDLYQGKRTNIMKDGAKNYDKTVLPMDLIEVLAELYPGIQDARSLWERAGGKASEVENISRPKDLWQKMWKLSTHGSIVTPVNLIKAASDEAPGNTVLAEYKAAYESE